MGSFYYLTRIACSLFLFPIFLLSPGCKDNTKSVEKAELSFLLDWKGGAYYLGFYNAQSLGYYEDEGLNVNFEEATGASEAAKIIGQGDYPIGLSTAASTLMALENDIPVTSVAVIYQIDPVVVFSHKDSPVRTPKDFAGKKIGIPFESIAYKEYQALVKKSEISRDLITEVAVGFDASPLLTRQVDALVGYTNNAAVQAEIKGAEIERLHLSDFGVNMYGTNIICNSHFLEQNPEIVRRFLRASIKGWTDAVSQQEDSVSRFLSAYPGHDEAFSRASFSATIPLLSAKQNVDEGGAPLGWQHPKRWNETQELLIEMELLEKHLDLDRVYTNSSL